MHVRFPGGRAINRAIGPAESYFADQPEPTLQKTESSKTNLERPDSQ
jgi:hypothetical protein